jgi:hypothetical protein
MRRLVRDLPNRTRLNCSTIHSCFINQHTRSAHDGSPTVLAHQSLVAPSVCGTHHLLGASIRAPVVLPRTSHRRPPIAVHSPASGGHGPPLARRFVGRVLSSVVMAGTRGVLPHPRHPPPMLSLGNQRQRDPCWYARRTHKARSPREAGRQALWQVNDPPILSFQRSASMAERNSWSRSHPLPRPTATNRPHCHSMIASQPSY